MLHQIIAITLFSIVCCLENLIFDQRQKGVDEHFGDCTWPVHIHSYLMGIVKYMSEARIAG